MSQIKCVKCHQNIDSSNKFCPYCGAPVQPENSDESLICPKCGYQNVSGSSFCEKCGTSLKADTSSVESQKQQSIKTYSSTGNYSGTMVKSKSSKSYRIFKSIAITILIIAVIAFVIWYNNDPNAKETVISVLFSVGFILIFVLIIWRKSKKGKMTASRKREANYDWDDLEEADRFDNDDDDFDDD